MFIMSFYLPQFQMPDSLLNGLLIFINRYSVHMNMHALSVNKQWIDSSLMVQHARLSIRRLKFQWFTFITVILNFDIEQVAKIHLNICGKSILKLVIKWPIFTIISFKIGKIFFNY